MLNSHRSARALTALSLAAAAALCLTFPIAAHAWSDNLLQNPGFEDGKAHWTADASWSVPDPYPEAQAVQAHPHSGLWSLRIGTATGRAAQTLAKPRPSTTYRVGAWGKVSQPGESGRLGVEWCDISGNCFAPEVEFNTTLYQYQEMEFTTPPTIDSVRVYAWKDHGTGYLYVDDVSLIGPDLQSSPGSTTYYVDSAGGDDDYPGTFALAPWRTLDKVNTVLFAPGDRVFLKAGSVWTGQLDPWGSGESGSPVLVDMYGQGPKPIIDGQGIVTAPMRLFNQEYWEVSNLELTNYDPGNVRERFGAWIAAEDAGTLHHLHLKDLDVHDVNGRNEDAYKTNGGIIFDIRGGGRQTRWDDVLVEKCSVRGVDRSGIWLASLWWDRNLSDTLPGHWVGSTNVVIRNNFVDDIGGDGIVPLMCSGPLVEYNTAKNCNKRSGRYCVAIWSWACDDTIIQYNEAYLTRTTMDGEGFDSDWFSNNTIIQYNYSHDNEGGFCLICANGTYPGGGFNDGTIVRYNISQNDQTRAFHIAGPLTNTSVYNNTIYIGEGMAVDPIIHTFWGGWADNTRFCNNIFYNLGAGDYILASSTSNAFDYNLFYGNHPAGEPADPHKLTNDPEFRNPGAAWLGRDSCLGYKLRSTSPCIDSGLTVSDHGDLDYWGNTVPSGLGVDRGAHEYPRFSDVPDDHWAFHEVTACVDAGIVQGYDDGCYHPEYPVSRDQMAVFISRAFADGDDRVPDGPAQATFDDVPPDHWAYKYIEYSVANDIVQGFDPITYGPTVTLSRDAMAVFISRAVAGGDASVPEGPAEATFDDVPTDHWAYKYIEHCAAEGIVHGYDPVTYAPTCTVTRDQMAVFISRAFKLL